MAPTATDIYVDSFLARCQAFLGSGGRAVDAPGIYGLLAESDEPVARLLVTDDRGVDALPAVLREARGGMISVLAAAVRCAQLMRRHSGWRPDTATAMVCRDLRTVPEVALPGELTFRAVRRLPGDGPDGVPLERAVAAVVLAAPSITDPPDVFADYLRSLPLAFRLFAAVDGDGVVRATSGSGAFGTDATVLFVNTDPGWRGRGIGTAMTAAALRAARESGARRASLDSSDAGARIYRRIGFESLGGTTRYLRAA
ncbi:MAG TPA: GNAT family N-acetyltransferase [Solirubrobacteraceae bacterium]